MKTKIDYDSEYDILYFYSGEKKVDFSIDYDDIILDASGNEISGVEIMDASKKFANAGENPKEVAKVLNSIKEAYMKVEYAVNSIIIKIGFISEIPERTKEGILIQVPIKRDMMVSM